MSIIHVYSDASSRGTKRSGIRFFGAYAIDDCSPVGFALECSTSVSAELLACAEGVRAARSHAPESCWTIHAHIDLEQVGRLIWHQRMRGAKELADALRDCDAEIHADASRYPQYQACHIHARKTAGAMPLSVSEKTTRYDRQDVKRRQAKIVELLAENADGIGVLDIVAATGLSMNIVNKQLRRMEIENEAVCDRPKEGIGRYDLTAWTWRLGRNWGVSVGAAMSDAGLASNAWRERA